MFWCLMFEICFLKHISKVFLQSHHASICNFFPSGYNAIIIKIMLFFFFFVCGSFFVGVRFSPVTYQSNPLPPKDAFWKHRWLMRDNYVNEKGHRFGASSLRRRESDGLLRHRRRRCVSAWRSEALRSGIFPSERAAVDAGSREQMRGIYSVSQIAARRGSDVTTRHTPDADLYLLFGLHQNVNPRGDARQGVGLYGRAMWFLYVDIKTSRGFYPPLKLWKNT